MPRLLPLIALALLGCGPSLYVPPSSAEPHAEVTVRIIHHEISGPRLAYRAMIDDRELPTGVGSTTGQSVPVTQTIRMRLQPTRWRFRSVFFHTEQRYETVYESQRYACGTQTTGYGRTQRTSTRYCTRQVPRQRLRTVRVTDGRCEAHAMHTPRAGVRYVIQYDYHANGHCRSRCFERTATGPGQFQLTPCTLSSGGSAR